MTERSVTQLDRLPGWLEQHRRLTPYLLFAGVLLCFAAGLNYPYAWDTIPNELLPVTLLREGNLEFSEYWHPDEFQPYFYKTPAGRIISFYPIPPGLLNVPVFALAYACGADIYQQRYFLSLLTAATVCALAVSIMYLILLELGLDLNAALGFALLFAFGTGALSVASKGIWQHGPSLLFLNLALYCLLRRDGKWLSWSGFWLGWAVFNRPVNLVFALSFALYMLLRHPRRCPVFFGLAALPAIVLEWYSVRYWGSLLAMGQGIEPEGFSGKMLTGLPGVLISPGRGLLVYSPFLIFALPPLFRALWRQGESPALPYLAYAILITLLMYGKWPMWWGGWCFGYRMLIELTPGLIIFTALAWNSGLSGRSRLRILFYGLAALSIYIHFLGAIVYPSDYNYMPDNIDQHNERLWYPLDNELTRCTKIFLRRVYEDRLF